MQFGLFCSPKADSGNLVIPFFAGERVAAVE
jgi:hypothetical protein